MVSFIDAHEADQGEAIKVVAHSCHLAGLPEETTSSACKLWMASGAPGEMPYSMISAMFSLWEKDIEEGLENLKASARWLRIEATSVLQARHLLGEHSRLKLQAAATGMDCVVGAVDQTEKIPSLPDVQTSYQALAPAIGQVGLASYQQALALRWQEAVPGLPAESVESFLEDFLRGEVSSNEFIDAMATETAQELKWNYLRKSTATFGDQRPDGMDGSYLPAWRVEESRKVPWFVPKSVVQEAFAGLPTGEDQLSTAEDWRFSTVQGKWNNHALNTVTESDMFKAKTDGACMYCGSTADVRAMQFWPRHLGGEDRSSSPNFVACCPVCSQMKKLLGPKRWGEVLQADPQEAREAWWQSQKEANKLYSAGVSKVMADDLGDDPY